MAEQRLIDANAFKENMFKYAAPEMVWDMADIIHKIDEMPTIEEHKTGKWIDYIGEDLGVDGQWLRDDGKTVFVQCDQCKSLYVRNFMNHWHWCPRCGCKMEGEQP